MSGQCKFSENSGFLFFLFVLLMLSGVLDRCTILDAIETSCAPVAEVQPGVEGP